VFRYINISVFALAIAGVASAGGIDPTAGTYSSSDGALYTTSTLPAGVTFTAEPKYPAIPVNAAAISAGSILNYTGSSAADTNTGCTGAAYASIFGASGGSCEGAFGLGTTGGSPGSGAQDFLFAPGTVGGTDTLNVNFANPVTLLGFEIYLQDDDGTNTDNHAASALNFSNNVLSEDPIGTASSLGSIQILTGSQNYGEMLGCNTGTLPGSGTFCGLLITDIFSSAVTGSSFSFNFTDASGNGVRILAAELLSAPEPGTWMLAGFGMLGLFAATKMRNRRLQSKL